MGAEDQRIQSILKGIDEEDDLAAMKAWGAHLHKVLQFPFEAKVAEFQEKGSLQKGDKVEVLAISAVEDLYGILVDVRHGQKPYGFPFCDLEVNDRKSSNYQPVHDYVVWFANR